MTACEGLVEEISMKLSVFLHNKKMEGPLSRLLVGLFVQLL